MFSNKINIVVFIFIIFIICTLFFFQNRQNLDSFKENLINNLELVEKFDKKEIKFNLIVQPSEEIIKYKTFYNVSIFPELSNIKYDVVKKELMDYLNQTNNKWIEWPEYNLWKNKNTFSSWKVLPLMAFSKWSTKNTKIFPKTTEQLKKINGLVSAGFSKLGPGTTLTLHKGWGNLSNNVLRCHLGLVVPENKCKVYVLGNVNDEMIQKEGKWIVFDDSLYHSASNEDDKNERIILLIDIKRPENISKGESDIENSEELNNFVAEFNKY